MLGPIGSEIMRIFRLLSPEEIDKYIVREEEAVVASPQKLAAGAEYNLEDSSHPLPEKNKEDIKEEDNVVSFPHKKSETRVENQLDAENFKPKSETKIIEIDNPGGGDRTLESAGILSASRIKEIEKKRLAEEHNKKDSTTVFLIKERLKARKAKQLLAESYAISLYQKNANQEFGQEVEIDEEGNRISDPMKGILLNKKQY